jgi:hypothetical protein
MRNGAAALDTVPQWQMVANVCRCLKFILLMPNFYQYAAYYAFDAGSAIQPMRGMHIGSLVQQVVII